MPVCEVGRQGSAAALEDAPFSVADGTCVIQQQLAGQGFGEKSEVSASLKPTDVPTPSAPHTADPVRAQLVVSCQGEAGAGTLKRVSPSRMDAIGGDTLLPA